MSASSGRRHHGAPIDREKGLIEMVHGSGGRASAQLVDEIFLPAFDNQWLRPLGDQARILLEGGPWTMTTDSYVITPYFFPGGDIGSLAVHGTVNDLSMGGAVPLYLTAAFILEEGFPIKDLATITNSMALAAKEAGVALVTGDTKVVEKGKGGDGIYINTSGIGRIPEGVYLDPSKIRPGDTILLSGSIGDHGSAVLAARENWGLSTSLLSDSASLHGLVACMLESAPGLVCLRDPTRGGVATSLNEWAQTAGVDLLIDEERLPVREEVRGICELLGLDPLYLANEGKLLAVCRKQDADRLLLTMKNHPLGRNSVILGHVTGEAPNGRSGQVRMTTPMGGTRMVDWLRGDPLPRIC
ncbi:hydrogenase expression/formation protein HypE [Leptospirillum ferrooxidans]|uniref:Putative hydrogenase expression/formation protein n=2 Tax=root TaxID=1 RepID=I0IS62_LEPFC|nr:hydrogenase expression/formation protein HypE [Leptospirillum ferrooxidans]MDA8149662.1 hydrogenase expression/formation protein HypE [Nitrospiraceae bacterium]BAM08111.1 putative hydrogenase expression/formation protein [Leptospirillum ferrooxidans C2-3]